MKNREFEIILNEKLNINSWPRTKIFFLWLIGTIVCMVPGTLITGSIFYGRYMLVSGRYREIATDFLSCIEAIPVGWLLHILSPLGWPSIIALISAIYSKRPIYLVYSAAIAIFAGFIWPPIGQSIAEF